MAQTILLTVKSYEFDAGTNITNPMGFMIRIATDEGESLRMYFFAPDVGTPGSFGFRSRLDGALALFLQRRDYASYVLLLDQAKASHIKVTVEDDGEITFFELSSAPFPADVQGPEVREADAAELENRTGRS